LFDGARHLNRMLRDMFAKNLAECVEHGQMQGIAGLITR
jgi:hypothetical protein